MGIRELSSGSDDRGNHEFYNNGDIAAQGESWQKTFLPNVGYYHNKMVRIDNADFILSTLLSRIPPVDEFAIRNSMNDYSQIYYNKRRLTPQNINDGFEKIFVLSIRWSMRAMQ